MDPKTQVSRLHGVSVLDMATKSFESNLMLALLRVYPDLMTVFTKARAMQPLF